MKSALLAVVVLTVAGTAFHFAGPGSGSSSAVKASNFEPAAHPAFSSNSLSLPLFFEPNQGQTDGRVRFLARGAGYGLFLTANEAVLSLEHRGVRGQPSTGSVIRMQLDGASSRARIRGTHLLPGKSSYFIGNDPAQWRRGVPQFARVEYQGVYPGVDLVYYGNQQQLEYDFRVSPGARPDQIALSFRGASAHLESGDLVLSTAGGDVRFHAPHVYQPGANAEKTIAGSFRQMADNQIGFTVGAYDHSRELVIDPLLSYSTYLGGELQESLVQVAVDAGSLIYVAGSTTSTLFPVTAGAIQSTLDGAQNIFIAKINPLPAPGSPQLVYATYLGGSGTDSLAGIAVDPKNGAPNVYVAGFTTSPNFPTTLANAFQTTATFTLPNQTHGFLTKLSPATGGVYQLAYSTYVGGNGTDTVTGLAVDTIQNAYLTGVTNSTDTPDKGFPANPDGFQLASNSPGNNQFFASKINTTGTGTLSMLYSTFFGGGNPVGASAIGGGIAVDVGGNLLFTGGTNMLGVTGPNQEVKFPLFNAYQSCLNNSCTVPDSSSTDAIMVELNPSQNQPQAPPLFSTYLGGSQNDIGIAVAVDTSSNAYVTGSTNSPTGGVVDWNCVAPCLLGPFGYLGAGGNTNAFVAKIGNQTQANTIFPLNFFTFIGGSGPDSGQAIVVDSVGTAHVAGTTSSSNLPVVNWLPQGKMYGGGSSDAFAALISTTVATVPGQPPPAGDYLTYLGGSQQDQGTGIALDLNNTAYVVGTTQSSNFPTANPLQSTLNGVQNAFATQIGANSKVVVAAPTGSPSPSPVPAGIQATFLFNLTNSGPDPATNVFFQATVPTTGIQSPPTATVNTGGGNCTPQALGAILLCNIGTLAVNGVATVSVEVTPSIPVNPLDPQITVSGVASANGAGSTQGPVTQQDNITDFTMVPSPSALTINAGETASFPITLIPGPLGYNASIAMSESSKPGIVTNPAPTFTVTPVILSLTGQQSTTLNIATVQRPPNTGSLFRRTSFYASWLPIGGLSLAGLGIGASRKRRRWLAGALVGLLAGLILLQPACKSYSSPVGTSGGTAAGTYTITVTGSTASVAGHSCLVTLNVN